MRRLLLPPPGMWPCDVHILEEYPAAALRKQLLATCCQWLRRRPAASKRRFLHSLRLHPRRLKTEPRAPLPTPQPAKLAACVHIPFSSDVGRIMAAREHHSISDDLKMRRLDRSEWYTNKGAARGSEPDFEVTPFKEPPHSHSYKMPKRQNHQQRRSLHDAEFLARFCTPVSVVLRRLDLDKVCDKKRLVVLIRDTEKMCCDLRGEAKIVRTSPRLRNV